MCVCGCEYTAWAGVCTCEHVGCVRPSRQVQVRKQLCLAVEGTRFWGALTSASDSCLTQIRRALLWLGCQAEARGCWGCGEGAASRRGQQGQVDRVRGWGGGGRREGAFKAPAPPTGEQCRESQRCLPLAHSVAVLPELWSSLKPQQIPLTELTTRTPDQVMA